MTRIIMMVLKNILYIPVMLVKLYRYSGNLSSYSLEKRYGFIREIVNRAVRRGNLDLKIYGEENLPDQDGFIIYANHQGMFDPLAVIQACPKPLAVVVKKELSTTPFLKTGLKVLGALFIDREDLRQSMQVILTMTKEVKEGRNYLIFPEGTRSKKGNEMLTFKGGSFKAVMKAKAPVVPVALIDTYKLFDDGSTKKAEAQIHILPSIPYDEYKDLKSTELAEEVQRRIGETINNYK